MDQRPPQPFVVQGRPQPPFGTAPPLSPGSRAGRAIVAATAAVLVLGGVAVAGLYFVGSAAGPDSGGSSGAGDAPVRDVARRPTNSGPGAPTTTDCYTFTMPARYRLVPGSSGGCHAYLNLPDGDMLTALDVSPVKASADGFDADVRRVTESIAASGGTLTSSREVTVDGRRGVRFRYTDGVGVRRDYVFVAESHPHWRTSSGDLIGAYTIGGPRIAQLDDILETLKFT